jgi:pimeloyl-ACP methyl ester carboxylesterase
MRRLRPLKALVHDAVEATTDLVEAGHDSAARRVKQAASLVPGAEKPVEAVDTVRALGTGAVLDTVRAVNRAVEKVTDAALDLAPLPEPAEESARTIDEPTLMTPGGAADQLVGMLNGAVGDHLARRGNGLDMGLRLRHGDRWLEGGAEAIEEAVPDATGHLAVFVHGLGTTEASWAFGAEAGLGDPRANYGTLLAHDLGCTPVFARYNTGMPILSSGAKLSAALEELVAAWPVPVTRISLIGHSMGGLVVRAASRAGDGGGWQAVLTDIVCIGSPHRGAPLAQVGEAATRVLTAIDVPATAVIGRIIGGRSAGVKDLSEGDKAVGPPLVAGVRHAFFAGSLTQDADGAMAHTLGDMLVPVGSAEGPGAAQVHTARFPGRGHHQLQADAEIHKALRDFLAGGAGEE